MIYSPLPIRSYNLLGSVDFEATFGARPSAWNLFWLSHPSLDRVPEVDDWQRVFRTKPNGMAEVMHDVLEDPELSEMLQKHPLDFSAWFSQIDHTIWDSSIVYGPQWPGVVLERCKLAAQHIVKGPNVYHVDFRRKSVSNRI